MISAVGHERGPLGFLASRRQDRDAEILRDRDRGHAHRRAAAVDQHRIVRREPELLERAPRRPERLGDRPQSRPVERRLDRDHMRRRQQRVV